MRKKLAIAMLIALLALFCACSSMTEDDKGNPTNAPITDVPTEVPTEQPAPSPTELDRDFGEIVAQIPIGSEAGKIYYRDPVADDTTNRPEGFAVKEDGIYVLNSVANNVLHFGENGEFINDFPYAPSTNWFLDGQIFAVANNKVYIACSPYEAMLYVHDLETGTRLSEVKLPRERGSIDPDDRYDNGYWYSADGFVCSIMMMYERDNKLVIVVRESRRLISSFVYDPDAASVERTDEYGFSGTIKGRNENNLVLHNNESGSDISFSLGELVLIGIFGMDSDGNLFVEAFEEADFQSIPRKVIKVGTDGSILGESTFIADLEYDGFTLGDDSNVYAMVRDGDHVNIIRVNLY